jgi:hypothetical protein
MLKIILCLLGAAIISAVLLQLRQQHLALSHQAAQLHDQIRSHQAKLWDQQVQIAVFTAPNAIQKTVDAHSLRLTPQTPVPGGNQSWIDVSNNPDAE